ncbi:GatB/YqeY domain-containing protein [Spiractinospora alimapuensis]|uniref:GatB/YqeY domain-containing protein n=1 Tax=Spiractinospora alimapuensis TaxID=2820884 RepID=UPI001F162489|nr:GatB/YqeY domain-containing protein [Spiractinospora alimapuensis]QVQ50374.1 GatB/YqeY domain-containing protein [Spiractinospora alimapuensis]
MSELKERLQSDLTSAMKQRDAVRARTLRMVLTVVSTESTSGETARELDDDEIQKIIAREVKKRREAAEAFDTGGREERAEAERAEAVVLGEYLPAQLGDDELAEIVSTVISETGATQMGAVMKEVLPRVGDRADGKRVSTEVRRQLA